MLYRYDDRRDLQVLTHSFPTRLSSDLAKFVKWSCIFVPAQVPAEVIETLRAITKRISNDPDIQAKVLGAGSPIEYMDAPEFQNYWDADDATLVKAVRAIGKVD